MSTFASLFHNNCVPFWCEEEDERNEEEEKKEGTKQKEDLEKTEESTPNIAMQCIVTLLCVSDEKVQIVAA